MPLVLVVDDARFSRNRVVAALQPAGFECLEAVDGAAALAALETRRPEVVVTDLLMPNVDGLTLLRTLRERGDETPVVVVSADIQSSSKAACAEMRVASFLNKPFKADELVAAVRAALPVKETVLA